MPLFSGIHHGHSHGHGLPSISTGTSSLSSSRPTSRPASPTRPNSWNSSQAAPETAFRRISRDNTVDSVDAINDTHPSAGTSPAQGEMWGNQIGNFNVAPVEIILDSERLVMRGQGGDMNPAYLSGRVDLNLQESANIKGISMNLTGKAKIQFIEGTGTGSKNHHHTHTVLSHDWSFLEGDKRHTHTLKAGHHSFPFSLMLDGVLPSTIHTYSGDADISYKLRADVVRSGFSSNFHDSKTFTLTRTYTPEALEFNQTLEIENTWPGKVMYALTLPFKAYAAGDDIPVNVKFMPLAKGVKVLSVTSVLKEYSRVHTRNSSHPDSRVALSVKHELRNGQAILVLEEPQRPPSHYHDSHFSSRQNSVVGLASHREALPESTSSHAGPSTSSTTEEDVDIGDEEIDTAISIAIPPWTTASHSTHPVFITHKIKWSCSISNPDGHISELRCALPIIILDHTLLDEARAAGAPSRGLLFGGAAAEEAQQTDLPSYNNHVYDRVAVADSGNTSGFLPRSSHTTPPHLTPPQSRPVSRPSSPILAPVPLDDLPPRRQLSSWADSELLLSLGSLQAHSNGSSPQDTPAASRGPSRPLSRRNSRSGRNSGPGSRGGSRTSSPERTALPDEVPRGGFSIFNHLPFNPMRPSSAKPILRNSSAVLDTAPNDVPHRNAVSFTNLPDIGSRRISNGEPGGRRSRFHVAGSETPEPEGEVINQVPSYAIASRGFLGGGVVPINVGPPMYDEAERNIDRTRSETALNRLAADGPGIAGEEHRPSRVRAA